MELWTNKLHYGETLIDDRREDGMSEKRPEGGVDREGETLHELEWWDQYRRGSHENKDSMMSNL